MIRIASDIVVFFGSTSCYRYIILYCASKYMSFTYNYLINIYLRYETKIESQHKSNIKYNDYDYDYD